MKQLTIILLGLIGIAYGQSSPTSAKTRFVNGIYLGTKLDAYFNAADSNAIYWRADSSLMAKYKGTARALAFKGDSTDILSQVVRTFGAQTVGGNKTFSLDGSFNDVKIGRGGGSILTNTLVGGLSMASNTTGEQNAVFGFEAMKFNTIGSQNSVLGYTALSNNISGGENTVVGHSSMFYNTSGAQNTAIGDGALLENRASNENTAVGYSSLYYNRAGAKNTAIGTYSGGNTLPNRNQSGSNNTYIGYLSAPSDTANTNETVIGASAIGNGSNTVTIGNSSVTGNYFNGFLKQTSVTSALVKASATGQFEAAVAGTDYVSGGTGTINYIPKFTAIGVLNNSIMYDSGGTVAVGGNLSADTLLAIEHIVNRRLTSGNNMDIDFNNESGVGTQGNVAKIRVDGDGVSNDYGAISFWTGRINGSPITESMRINSLGNVTSLGVYSATVGGTNRDVFVDNTGLIGYVSSFRASKKNIAPISNTDWLHNLNPVTFNYRVKDSTGKYTDSAYKELEYGLVAEEVEPVNPEMVFYDVDSVGNKKLRGVHYSKLIIPLLAEVKEHKKKIDAQQTIIEALLTRIKALEAKLN